MLTVLNTDGESEVRISTTVPEGVAVGAATGWTKVKPDGVAPFATASFCSSAVSSGVIGSSPMCTIVS
eukprot:4858009-Prymnesium_polylepis.1